MDELIGKLTNLTYELFGVIIPGAVMTVLLLVWWSAMGPLMSDMTGNAIPFLTAKEGLALLETLSGLISAALFLTLAYFLGHLLLWIARSGPTLERGPAPRKTLKRVGFCLLFQIPKPADSFDQALQPLFDKVAPLVLPSVTQPGWREFFPVAKSVIAQHLKYSLVATYQNKYTLHRSLVTAATVLWWLSIAGMLAGALPLWASPHWPALAALAAFALLLVWGFSGSYLYHWKMFGNTIVSESYAFLIGPSSAPPAK
jgi:hypothetical protein